MEAPALDRGLAILERLDTEGRGLSLTEISAAIGSPKNSTSRLLQTLIGRGYLRRDDEAQLFSLTGKLLRLGQPRVAQVSLVACALPVLPWLREATQETVQLGISIGDEGVVIEKIESTLPVRIGVDIGLRFPLHSNAPGKVLLAFQPAAEREQTIQRLKLKRYTPRTITDRKALAQECERVAAQGYAVDCGEADEGIRCVAAPIFAQSQQLCATLWMSAPAGRLPKAKFASVAAAVRQAARAVELNLAT